MADGRFSRQVEIAHCLADTGTERADTLREYQRIRSLIHRCRRRHEIEGQLRKVGVVLDRVEANVGVFPTRLQREAELLLARRLRVLCTSQVRPRPHKDPEPSSKKQ